MHKHKARPASAPEAPAGNSIGPTAAAYQAPSSVDASDAVSGCGGERNELRAGWGGGEGLLWLGEEASMRGRDSLIAALRALVASPMPWELGREPWVVEGKKRCAACLAREAEGPWPRQGAKHESAGHGMPALASADVPVSRACVTSPVQGLEALHARQAACCAAPIAGNAPFILGRLSSQACPYVYQTPPASHTPPPPNLSKPKRLPTTHQSCRSSPANPPSTPPPSPSWSTVSWGRGHARTRRLASAVPRARCCSLALPLLPRDLGCLSRSASEQQGR